MSKALKLQSALNNFVEKLAHVNKPFQALVSTAKYSDFHDSFRDAIRAQAKWAADHMGEIDRHGDVAAYTQRNMPMLTDLIDVEDVFNYYVYAYEWGAKAQYERWGIKKAANSYSSFALTNPTYLDKLHDNASYLLSTKSSIDATTADKIISIIQDGKDEVDDDGNDFPATNAEIAGRISDQFDDISDSRADMIARTETANSMGDADMDTMIENGIAEYDWVAAGDNPCPICQDNADGSPYEVGDDSAPDYPAHPNDECYREGDPDSIDLDSISIWDGS
jgi:hypothetical protein